MRKPRQRRRLSLTSLIDVIFLLLLFFMLTSTFTRFGEIELLAAGGGAPGTGPKPVFLSLGPDTLGLNGQERTLAALPATLTGQAVEGEDLPVIVALRGDVSAQRLTDLLAVLRSVPGLLVTVLETP